MRILPKKSLGQNFLTDNRVLNLITDIGKINRNDTILEVGPGTGALTKKILEKKPKKFIVIEKDKLLTNNLKKKFGNSLEIINECIKVNTKNIY